ncbi:hypothetical protein D3C79_1068470 [compost metagenome]
MTIPQHRRLPEVAAQSMRFATRQNGCSFFYRILYVLADLGHCRCFNQRPDHRALFQPVPHF